MADIDFFDENLSCDRRVHPCTRRSSKSISATFLKHDIYINEYKLLNNEKYNMQLIYEILPVFLFFLAFKFCGIYVATSVGIIATLVQSILTRLVTKKWDKKQLITLGVFSFFGGLTLYMHDPIFVKWKPTIIFWIFAMVLIGSQLFTKKPLIQRMMVKAMEGNYVIPTTVWGRLNLMWAVFFAGLGTLNLYVAYHYNNDVWVNFKFYGISVALIVFSILQALYLARYMQEESGAK